MRSNQQIVRANGPTPPSERVADVAIVGPGVRVKWQDVEVAAERLEFACVALDAFGVGDPVAQFGIVIEEMTTRAAAASKRTPQRFISVIDEIDAHVGVQHEHQRMSSRPSSGGWRRGGKVPRDSASKNAAQSFPRGRSVT